MKPDPKLCFHKSRKLYFVRLSGKTFYLGSDRAAAERGRLLLLVDWKSSGGAFAARPPQEEITITEIFARWLAYAEEYYSRNPTHLGWIKAAHRDFLAVYGSMRAVDFGPRALKSYRQSICDGTLARCTANKKVMAIRAVFRWAASEELIPVTVSQALCTVAGLHAGRAFGVRESRPVTAVPWEHVAACLPYMPRPVADLMRLAWHTGARIGELINLRTRDIDRSGPVWQYTLRDHKTAHHGRARVLCFGPEAQKILRTAMLRAPLGRVLFSPLDSVADRAQAAPTHRRPNQKNNPRMTDRVVGDAYDVHAINRAVNRAIKKCNADPARADLPKIPHWHVHQIRHSFATRVRKEIGLEAAAAALGHADARTTQIYAELESGMAAKVAERLG